jgi:phosphopantothenoylcysteine synthetase/decarboxylase
MSKRFVMKLFMGLSDAEIKENERMWMEEKGIDIELAKTNASEGDINVPNDEDIDELEDEELETEEQEAEGDDENLDFDMDFDSGGENEQ